MYNRETLLKLATINNQIDMLQKQASILSGGLPASTAHEGAALFRRLIGGMDDAQRLAVQRLGINGGNVAQFATPYGRINFQNGPAYRKLLNKFTNGSSAEELAAARAMIAENLRTARGARAAEYNVSHSAFNNMQEASLMDALGSYMPDGMTAAAYGGVGVGAAGLGAGAYAATRPDPSLFSFGGSELDQLARLLGY